MTTVRIAVFLSSLFSIGLVYAGGANLTPMELPGGKIVTVSELSSLMKSGVTIVDTRSAVNFGRGHIPGAVLIPYKGKSKNVPDFNGDLDRFSLDKLNLKSSDPLVFYSHGDTGWKSYKAASYAIKQGFDKVYWFRNGLSAWQRSDQAIEH
ncbi:MAG: rhodanese-like domain-containing protein [Oceanospirillum sp.]|nr:rhodanese-like domain-containing protein [Oceanospirillum sp.]